MAHIESMSPEYELEAINLKLRDCDIAEVVAATGKQPAEVLKDSIHLSRCWVMIHEGKIEGVFGVNEETEWGVPWMLATDNLYKFRKEFLKCSKLIVECWLEQYPALCNCVDSRHTEAIRWLKWLGFTIHYDQPTKLDDPEVDFYLFTQHSTTFRR